MSCFRFLYNTNRDGKGIKNILGISLTDEEVRLILQKGEILRAGNLNFRSKEMKERFFKRPIEVRVQII